MKFRFHPQADAEFAAAVRYYEDCRRGLGLDFAGEVYAAIARISKYPEAWAPLSKSTRRCLVNRFPYGIVFQTKAGILRIVALSNLHRRPGYWKDRT